MRYRLPEFLTVILLFSSNPDKQDAWREYYTYGGLPLIQSFKTEEKKINYLKDLFETVYLADIIERHKIKNDNELRKWVRIQLEVDFIASIGSKKYYV